MRRLLRILMLAAAWVLPACVSAPPMADVTFQRRDDARIVIDVEVNGQGPYPFILDTGAGATVLSAALIEELGLTQRAFGVVVYSVDSTTRAPAYEGVTIGVGDATFVTPWVVSLEPPERASGVLGMDILSQRAVEIDGPQRRVRLHTGRFTPPQRSRVARAPLVIDATGLPHADVSVNDAPGRALIDTGLAGVIMDPGYAERARVDASHETFHFVDLTNTTSRVRRAGDGLLRLGPVRWRVRNMAIFRPAVLDRLGTGQSTEMILGARVFETASLVLDVPRGEMFLVHDTTMRTGTRTLAQ